MTSPSPSDLPPSAVPVNGLAALEKGDAVHIVGRPRPLRVIESRVGYAELIGPDDGRTKLTDWKSSDREENEYSVEGGTERVELWCSRHEDGSKPQQPVGVPVDRTPVSGGFATGFMRGSEF